jgi:hypothetical protein
MRIHSKQQAAILYLFSGGKETPLFDSAIAQQHYREIRMRSIVQ